MLNDELLHKWINNNISEEELRVFKQRPEFEELTAIYRQTEDLKGPKLDSDAMLADILQAPKMTATKTEVKKKPLIFRLLPIGVAAAVLFLCGYFVQDYFFENGFGSQTFTTDAKELTRKLPDESTFVLKEKSSLTYNEKKWDKERLVKLEGEAFFDVSPGSTFTVETNLGIVEVLGTEFTVSDRGEGLLVTCQEGKVAVTPNDANSEREELLGKEEIFISNSGAIVLKKRNHTSLRKASFEEVKSSIEKKFGVEIRSNGFQSNELLNCSYGHVDLTLALSTCLSSFDLSFEEVEPNVLSIKQ